MININIVNDYNANFTYNYNLINKLVTNVFDEKKIKKINLLIILSKKSYLNKLKMKFFNVNQYTDVIAFNLSDNNDCLEGEIYISIDDVRENSEIYNQSFNAEFKRVLIHGALHLIGFNDKTDEDITIMRSLEEKFLKKFGKKIIIK